LQPLFCEIGAQVRHSEFYTVKDHHQLFDAQAFFEFAKGCEAGQRQRFAGNKS